MRVVLPSSLRGKVCGEWQGQLRQEGEFRMTYAFSTGTARLRAGTQIGTVLIREQANNSPVQSKVILVGTLRVGGVEHLVAVTPGWDGIWLALPHSGRPGTARLWLAGGVKMRDPWGFEQSHRTWGEQLGKPISLLLEGLVEKLNADQRADAHAWQELRRQYHATVSAALESAILACSRHGLDRTATDFARGVSASWERADLFSFTPTVAEVLALALALTGPYTQHADVPDRAARAQAARHVAQLGLMLAEGVALVDADALTALLTSATTRLCQLVPAWADAGLWTDWRLLQEATPGGPAIALLDRWREDGGARIVTRYPLLDRSSSGYVEAGQPASMLVLRNRHTPQPTSANDERRATTARPRPEEEQEGG